MESSKSEKKLKRAENFSLIMAILCAFSIGFLISSTLVAKYYEKKITNDYYYELYQNEEPDYM